MYEVIEITSRKSLGVYGSFASAMSWVKAHGGLDLFLILPW